ncbi:rhodanese-like domain-containing protein, partial [Acinetobacter baumannii]
DAEAEFVAGHIPGAQRFDIDTVKDADSDLPHMMPPTPVFSAALRKLGIGDGQSVLIYDGAGLFSAPRVWWMFRTFGVERVFILD